ncbi:MAG: phospholipase [Spirochaetaceae bacterium]|nr:phospholipase [Spirochaetaceae bacterium]|tara:strand:+ start:53718 stop:54029 length:312 start_codon:yes stop_codon:yes gene_type:complete
MEKAFDNPGFIQLLLNFYGYYVPFILLAVWAPLALYDLARRQDVEGKTGAIWVGAIVALPLVGAGAYHLIGKSQLPAWVRNYLVIGGTVLLVVLLLISSVLGT